MHLLGPARREDSFGMQSLARRRCNEADQPQIIEDGRRRFELYRVHLWSQNRPRSLHNFLARTEGKEWACHGSGGLRSAGARGGRIFRLGRQMKGDARAFTPFAFGPYFSLMPPHDTLDGGQADARAGKLMVAMEALEGREKFSGISHVKTRAVV